MGKQSPKALKPQEIEALARQQNRMNNPNVSNIFGSTNTVFDANDQANITQTLSPEMQGLINSQMDFVGQGPAQMGDFSNPFLQGMMQNTANSLARTGGWGQSPDASQMGGFSGSAPQWNQNQPPPPSPQPDPQLSFGLQGSPQGNPQPTVTPQSGGFNPQALAGALSQMSGGGGQSPYSSMGLNIGQLLQKKPNEQPEGY